MINLISINVERQKMCKFGRKKKRVFNHIFIDYNKQNKVVFYLYMRNQRNLPSRHVKIVFDLYSDTV